MRRRTALTTALVLLAAAPAAAQAGSVAAPNACKWSIDDVWRDLDAVLDGTAAPNPVGPGGTVTQSGTRISTRLAEPLARSGYDLGLLTPGENRIPATVWLATSGPGGVQTTQGTVTVVTTITTDDQGNYVSSTPMDVVVPLADQAWTAPASGSFLLAQASPGALPPLPTGVDGALRKPLGSLVVQAVLGERTRLVLDCQPGRGTPAGDAVTPGPPAAYDAVAVAADAPAPPPPALTPKAPGPQPEVVSTRLRVRAGAELPVKVRCTGTAGACFGLVEVRTTAKQRVGRVRKVVVLGTTSYAVPAGATRTVTLDLTKLGRSLLRRKPSVGVRVRLLPRGAAAALPATRMTLRRS